MTREERELLLTVAHAVLNLGYYLKQRQSAAARMEIDGYMVGITRGIAKLNGEG